MYQLNGLKKEKQSEKIPTTHKQFHPNCVNGVADVSTQFINITSSVGLPAAASHAPFFVNLVLEAERLTGAFYISLIQK